MLKTSHEVLTEKITLRIPTVLPLPEKDHEATALPVPS